MSTPDNGAPQQAGAPAPDGAQANADAAPTPAPKLYPEDHVKQLIRERDEAKAALRAAPASKKEPAPSASEVADLRAELELKDAIQDVAPHLTREQRNMVRDLFKVQRPGPDGIEAWITKTASAFGRTQTAAPVKSEPAPVSQQAAAPRTGSLGTPATATTETMPTDPHELVRRGLWASLTPEQRKAAMDAKAAQSSPFAARFAQAAKRKG